ncbi:hypothetical protein P4I29_18720 [Escherichia coli]|nr:MULTISPECIES: hypothetical protein [Enterobacteriaceae]MCA7238790.1 hypothetical protein [Escherichia coli]MCB5838859.1 hypothetical protein [Shigella sonnei]MCB5843564.1 hypothetical protein [Shigella sonnei]MCF1836301.1 hypothetical protein [Escherichia coli]MCS1165271.1 hypothetical protein [Escherichia coli]
MVLNVVLAGGFDCVRRP